MYLCTGNFWYDFIIIISSSTYYHIKYKFYRIYDEILYNYYNL